MVWWRICLDEAQMIEASAAAAARMALRLKTVHRWCVSGTPIWKGNLDDLYGLLLFLQVSPFDRRSWWRHAIEFLHEKGDPDAASRLHRLLSAIMWRTSKKSVLDQLALPPQTERTRILHFSQVERAYYQTQYKECIGKVRVVVRKIKRMQQQQQQRTSGRAQDPTKRKFSAITALETCAGPLLRLRQACCHPQIGAGGLGGLRQGRGIMTMQEVLEKLEEDEKLRCEETQRLLMMELSGLGSMARIQGELWERKRRKQRDESEKDTKGNGTPAKASTSPSAEDVREEGNARESDGRSKAHSTKKAGQEHGGISGKLKCLTEAASYYEQALLTAERNRQPVPIGGVEGLEGAPRFKGRESRDVDAGNDGRMEGRKKQWTVINLEWEMKQEQKEGSTVEEGLLDVDAVRQKDSQNEDLHPASTWTATEHSPLWASVTFQGGNKKIMGLRVWPLVNSEDSGGEGAQKKVEDLVYMPGKCRLMACCSPEGALFVEAGVFDLKELMREEGDKGTGKEGKDGGMGGKLILGFNMLAAKTWKLEVLDVIRRKGRREEGKEGGIIKAVMKVELLVADIEVDPLQILHVTTNLHRVFQEIKGIAGGEVDSGSHSAKIVSSLLSPPNSPSPANEGVTASTQAKHEQESARLMSTDVGVTVRRYEDVYQLHIAEKIEWLDARVRAVTQRECNLARLMHQANRQHFASASQALDALDGEIDKLRKRGGKAAGQGRIVWWEWTLNELMFRGDLLDPKADLLRRLKVESSGPQFPAFHDYHGLMMALKLKSKDLDETRTRVNALLRRVLVDNPSEGERQRNSDCGVCRKDWGKSGPLCHICELEKHLKAYEEKLHTYREQRQQNGHTVGTFKHSCCTHRLLYSVLLPWLRHQALKRKSNPEWQHAWEEAMVDNRKEELLERERKMAKRFWNSGFDLLSKLDEVACSALSLELAQEGEIVKDMSSELRKLVVFPHEVDVKKEEYRMQVAKYEVELRERKGYLKYLQNIAKNEARAAAERNAAMARKMQEEVKSNASSQRKDGAFREGPRIPTSIDPCASSGILHGNDEEGEEDNMNLCFVCFEEYTVINPREVLPCAHHLCKTCLRQLLGKRAQNKCPKCRRNFHRNACAEVQESREGKCKDMEENGKDIRVGEEEFYMDEAVQEEGEEEEEEEEEEAEEEEEEDEGPRVEGSWGTKITALVSEVLRLPVEDKCLIFSEWDEMLDIVQQALQTNRVDIVRLKGERTAGRVRQEFRENESVRCMLLNLKSGAKGLTLVEANHVFLLEPIFNAATEAQAVNRVFRIGQTKPTVIHRFVVRNTIEENVEKMRQSKVAAAGGESAVLSAVKKQGKARKTDVELDVEEMEKLFATTPRAIRRSIMSSPDIASGATVDHMASSGGGGHRNGRRPWQRKINMDRAGEGSSLSNLVNVGEYDGEDGEGMATEVEDGTSGAVECVTRDSSGQDGAVRAVQAGTVQSGGENRNMNPPTEMMVDNNNFEEREVTKGGRRLGGAAVAGRGRGCSRSVLLRQSNGI
jgi:hypothetical protein